MHIDSNALEGDEETMVSEESSNYENTLTMRSGIAHVSGRIDLPALTAFSCPWYAFGNVNSVVLESSG